MGKKPGKKGKSPEATQSQPAPSRKDGRLPLPLIIEVGLSLAKALVILIGLVVSALSLYSGATIFAATVRSGAAMIAVGLVLWLANWHISRHALEMARGELAREHEALGSDYAASTVEKSA